MVFEPSQKIANTTISINVSTETDKIRLGLGIGLGVPGFIVTAIGAWIGWLSYVRKRDAKKQNTVNKDRE